MSLGHKAVHVSTQQINSGQQRYRTVAHVFVVAQPAGMLTGDGRSIHPRAANGLNVWLSSVGKHGYGLALGLTLFAQQLDLLVYKQGQCIILTESLAPF